MAAGNEERAVLLFNYLRSHAYDVYILLGMSIPHGDTAYVLYQEKNLQTMRLINPSTGNSLDVKDSTSSLQQVWALFNQNDVITHISVWDISLSLCATVLGKHAIASTPESIELSS